VSGTLADPCIHVAHFEDAYQDKSEFLAPVPLDHRVRSRLRPPGQRQPDPELRELAPYDIVRTSEDSYRITMAVVGFSESELAITHQPNLLIAAGNKSETEGECLHRGLPGTSFERRFELADHVEVAHADLQNGLLTIVPVREVPEEMKPRKISIKADEPAVGSKRIEGGKQAA
jgi:molecular chaperone IbpA